MFADQLNEMDITKVIGKLSGGFLVIENANPTDTGNSGYSG